MRAYYEVEYSYRNRITGEVVVRQHYLTAYSTMEAERITRQEKSTGAFHNSIKIHGVTQKHLIEKGS